AVTASSAIRSSTELMRGGAPFPFRLRRHASSPRGNCQGSPTRSQSCSAQGTQPSRRYVLIASIEAEGVEAGDAPMNDGAAILDDADQHPHPLDGRNHLALERPVAIHVRWRNEKLRAACIARP